MTIHNLTDNNQVNAALFNEQVAADLLVRNGFSAPILVSAFHARSSSVGPGAVFNGTPVTKTNGME